MITSTQPGVTRETAAGRGVLGSWQAIKGLSYQVNRWKKTHLIWSRTIPCAGVLHCTNRRKWSECLHCCFLAVGVTWEAASSSCFHSIWVTSFCTLELWAKTNPFSVQLRSPGCFLPVTGKETKTGISIQTTANPWGAWEEVTKDLRENSEESSDPETETGDFLEGGSSHCTMPPQ